MDVPHPSNSPSLAAASRTRSSTNPLWTFTTRARVDSSPAIAGGRVFVGSNDGRVYGLDLASGKKVWEYEAASPVTSSPAVAKGKVVVATADGQVICFGSRQTPTVDSVSPKGVHFHSSSMQREADERS